jgi:hypothetical protein
MRAFAFLAAGILPAAVIAAPAHFEVGDTHVIVIRPIDSWDPNKTTAEYSLDGLRSRNFGFQYIDAAGTKIVPSSGGLFREKRSTPLSDEVYKIMAGSGFGNKGSHVYFVSAPVKLEAGQMADFVRAQNQLYRASVIKDGDPATLASRVTAKKAVSVLATAAVTKFGVDRFGVDAVNLSQYSTLYSDIAKLAGGASAALLPVPLPDFDYAGYSEIEVRRVTDNAGHVGEILIAYRNPKAPASEQGALAQAIAAAGGVGTTVEEVEATRAKNYQQRLAIWAECQAAPACAQQ